MILENYPTEVTEKDISADLMKLIEEYKFDVSFFIKMANAERFTKAEIHELGYMEDKFDIWLEMFEQ